MIDRRISRAAAFILFLSVAVSAWSHEIGGPTQPIGFNERLGQYVPLDTVFTGEDCKKILLGDIVKQPTVLLLVYYRCTNECTSIITGLSSALRTTQLVPGRDYKILTVSINEKESPNDAMVKKDIALAAVEAPFPPEDWRFLVGSVESIDSLADSVGFSYIRNGDDFDHPLGLVILSPNGKIVRYMTGTEFLPMDLGMSLLEASSGITRPTIAKMLRFCFSYNPQSRQFGFNLLRVSGTVIGSLVVGFAFYLILTGIKRRRKASAGGN